MSRHPSDPRSPRELIEHFVAADFGAGSKAAQDALDAYLDANPSAVPAEAELASLWQQLGELPGPPLAEDEPPLSSWRRVVSAATWPRVAAALLVVGIAGGLASYEASRPPESLVLESQSAERRMARLGDGSTVELSGETRVVVTYSDDARRLELTGGEALFDVAHDASRPFTVAAGGGEVRALGTAFNVKLVGSRVVVTVVRGRVQVAAQSDGAAAKLVEVADRGEQVTYGSNDPVRGGAAAVQISEPMAVDIAGALDWKQGMLQFDGEPLSEVIDEVNRHSRSRIVLHDARLADLKIYGLLHAGDVGGLASIVREREQLSDVEMNRVLTVESRQE